jgi:hypothetical protein
VILEKMPPGPWDSEPGEAAWVDTVTDFPCYIQRSGGGALCGYVCLPAGHPWHGESYNSIYELYPVDVHGGLTFSVQRGDYWVIGFDCSHSGDCVPCYSWTLANGTYRDMAYVKAQVTALARQAFDAWPILERLALAGEQKP